MDLIFRARDILFDFIFPKSARTLKLEALSIEDIVSTLPQASNLTEKSVTALFDYTNSTVREIVWEIKYRGNSRIAEIMGTILYDHISEELENLRLFGKWDKPILMPMPISDKRRDERGWNQSELLAKEVIVRDQAKLFAYLPKELIKTRHTVSQTKTRSRSERLKNVKNSMKVRDPSLVAGKSVVIIDDVTTTGSTFAEARRALRLAGAKKILCVAVAH